MDGHVYGSRVPRTPSSPCRSQSGAGRGLAEGCFCPDGHTLFNKHTNVCVRECGKPATAALSGAAEHEAEGLGWEGCSLGPPLLGAHTPSPVSTPGVPCGHDPGFSRALTPTGRRGPGQGWGRPGLQGHIPGPVVSALWAWDPSMPSDLHFSSLPACVGPDGFPKSVSVLPPATCPLA